MSYDVNECRFSGTVEGFTVVNTKTGTPMIRFFLACNKERIAVVAFKGLADATRLSDSDQVSVLGAIQSTSYKGQDGVMRYGFQVIANEITSEDETPAPALPPRTAPPAEGKRVSLQPYQGGPF